MKKECKYCREKIEHENFQVLAAHVRNCKQNPNLVEQNKKRGDKLRGKKRNHGLVAIDHKINCVGCQKEFIVKVTEQRFNKGKYTKHCSRNCANAHIRTEESKNKTSKALKDSIKAKEDRRRKKVKYIATLIEHKCFCGKTTLLGPRKTCSKECLRQLLSIQKSNWLSVPENRVNYGRHKKSYLETSFEEWLINNKILNYETEKRFYNEELEKNYFVDFFFKDKNVIIELDGTQHLKTVESDKVRDRYLESCGYKVLRITHKEYKNKSKEELIKSLII